MNKTTHLMHSEQITEASKEMVNDISTGRSQSAFDPSIDASGVIDLTVSFDGSWMKGGHSSSYGIGCVIEVMTRCVLHTASRTRIWAV